MKTVLITSLEQLYDLMVNNESIIYKDGRLAIIKDYLDAAYTGCNCQRKNNENHALENLKSLPTEVNISVIYELKSQIDADKIIFQLNNLSFEF
jgi:hypothetical protein